MKGKIVLVEIKLVYCSLFFFFFLLTVRNQKSVFSGECNAFLSLKQVLALLWALLRSKDQLQVYA